MGEENRYRILKKLAEGGSGETYLVWDVRLEKEWVMKGIRLQQDGGRTAAEREIQALKQIRKEGIPVLTDVFYKNGKLCLVMEYMQGISLEQKIQEGGPMEEIQVAACGVQIAQLLDTLHGHEKRLIHGDLKPANLIWNQGKIALLDFGAAVSEGGGNEACFYTPGYAAPEITHGEPMTVESDVYALGAVLFYLATGENPGNPRGIFPIREEHSLFSKKMEGLILKCTQSDAGKRFHSVKELIPELQMLAEKGKRGRLWRRRSIEGKRRFQVLESILLTEGKKIRAILLLFIGILSVAPVSKAVAPETEKEMLPVNIRRETGEKLLIDKEAVYHTSENPVFELPIKYFKEGAEYEITISGREKESGDVHYRTFVICID